MDAGTRICLEQVSVHFLSIEKVSIKLNLYIRTVIFDQFWRYIVKPHGQLVQVSLTPHNASTPCLSTL
jgi:hypothetical protein